MTRGHLRSPINVIDQLHRRMMFPLYSISCKYVLVSKISTVHNPKVKISMIFFVLGPPYPDPSADVRPSPMKKLKSRSRIIWLIFDGKGELYVLRRIKNLKFIETGIFNLWNVWLKLRIKRRWIFKKVFIFIKNYKKKYRNSAKRKSANFGLNLVI